MKIVKGTVIHNLSWFNIRFPNKIIYIMYINVKAPLHPSDDVGKVNNACLEPLNLPSPWGCCEITLQTKIFGFLLWALRHSKWLWRDENVIEAKLLTITPPLRKPHIQMLLTNRSSPLLHHLPLTSSVIKYCKITVDPLVSAHGIPTVLPLQGSAVPSGLPRSQGYSNVLSCLFATPFLTFFLFYLFIFYFLIVFYKGRLGALMGSLE